MVSKNLKAPNLSSMADDAITRGGLGGLISRVYLWFGCKKKKVSFIFSTFPFFFFRIMEAWGHHQIAQWGQEAFLCQCKYTTYGSFYTQHGREQIIKICPVYLHAFKATISLVSAVFALISEGSYFLWSWKWDSHCDSIIQRAKILG